MILKTLKKALLSIGLGILFSPLSYGIQGFTASPSPYSFIDPNGTLVTYTQSPSLAGHGYAFGPQTPMQGPGIGEQQFTFMNSAYGTPAASERLFDFALGSDLQPTLPFSLNSSTSLF